MSSFEVKALNVSPMRFGTVTANHVQSQFSMNNLYFGLNSAHWRYKGLYFPLGKRYLNKEMGAKNNQQPGFAGGHPPNY